MNNTIQAQTRRKQYGVAQQMSVEQNKEGLIVLRGVAQGKRVKAIKATLSRRASNLLWYRLTQLLYPDDAPHATQLLGTAPLGQALPEGELITTQIEVQPRHPDHYELIGRILNHEWSLHLSTSEAKRLWAKLDLSLFPYGWQGRENHPAQP